MPRQSLPLKTTRGSVGYLVEALMVEALMVEALNDVGIACVVTRRREVPHAADCYGDVNR